MEAESLGFCPLLQRPGGELPTPGHLVCQSASKLQYCMFLYLYFTLLFFWHVFLLPQQKSAGFYRLVESNVWIAKNN